MSNRNLIWVAYNHLPNGHLMARWFKTYKRKRKNGDATEEITQTAEAQLEGFMKEPQKTLCLNGKRVEDTVLVYDGDEDLENHPNPAAVVLAWAKTKGAAALPAAQAKVLEGNDKVAQLDARVAGLESSTAAIAQAIEKLASAIAGQEK